MTRTFYFLSRLNSHVIVGSKTQSILINASRRSLVILSFELSVYTRLLLE